MKKKDLSRFYPNAAKPENDEFVQKSDVAKLVSESYTQKKVFFSGNATVVDLG